MYIVFYNFGHTYSKLQYLSVSVVANTSIHIVGNMDAVLIFFVGSSVAKATFVHTFIFWTLAVKISRGKNVI